MATVVAVPPNGPETVQSFAGTNAQPPAPMAEKAAKAPAAKTKYLVIVAINQVISKPESVCVPPSHSAILKIRVIRVTFKDQVR
jgi:hypothetical protein